MSPAVGAFFAILPGAGAWPDRLGGRAVAHADRALPMAYSVVKDPGAHSARLRIIARRAGMSAHRRGRAEPDGR